MLWLPLALASLQDPAPISASKDFWSAEPAPAKAVPAPIVPEHWLVVPRDSNASVAQVFARYLLDPKSPTPAEGGDGIPWKSAESSRPAGIVAAFTRVTSERDEVRMARLTGAEWLFVNGDGFVGDVDGRGFRGVPVALRRGDNDLFVLGVPDSFELELWVPQTRTVLGSWDVAWPGETSHGDEIFYPVFNASTEPADHLHVHYENAIRADLPRDPSLGEWNDGGSILPLGVCVAWNYFGWFSLNDNSPRTDEEASVVPLCVYVDGDARPAAEFLHCAPASERKKAHASGLSPRSASALLGTSLSAFSMDGLFVFPSGETPARARFDQELCWYRARFTPTAISAEELLGVEPESSERRNRRTSDAWSKQHFVLYGNSETNAAWVRLVPEDLPVQVHAGHLVVNGKHYASEDICGWFQFRAASGKHVVVSASTGAKGARLGYLIQPLFRNTDGLDYCFWDASGEGETPREFTSGKFPKAKAESQGR